MLALCFAPAGLDLYDGISNAMIKQGESAGANTKLGIEQRKWKE